MKILDACCGSKMFWYDKHEPHTTYIDNRSEKDEVKDRQYIRDIVVSPDIIADFGKSQRQHSMVSVYQKEQKMSKEMTKNKIKKNVITFDNTNGEGCVINLNDFDYAAIIQIKTSDIYRVDIWNDDGALIGDYIVTGDVAEKINSKLEKVTKKRKEIKMMKPKVINKRVVQFSDIYGNPHEIPEKDIYGVEIQVQDNERKLIYYKLIYYLNIISSANIAISKETYDSFIRMFEQRVADKNDK